MHWSIEARGYHKVNPHYLMCHNENVTTNTPYQQNHNTFIMVLAMFGPAVKQCVSQPYTQSSTVYDTLPLLATLGHLGTYTESFGMLWMLLGILIPPPVSHEL